MSVNAVMQTEFSTHIVPRDATAVRPEANSRSAFDLVMRDSPELSRALLEERTLSSWILKLLGISVLGLGIHGLAIGLVAHLLPHRTADVSFFVAQGHPLVWLPLTMIGALLGGLAICLPSFYFYTQLSGLDASFRLVTAQALRVQAKTSVLLLAALPFYVALALGGAVQHVMDAEPIVAIGLALPFLVGLLGLHTLQQAFVELLEFIPMTHVRRGDFLLRMVLCWGAVYSVVTPVAVYRLGEFLARLI